MRICWIIALALLASLLTGCGGYRRAVMAEDRLAAGSDAVARRAWDKAGREFAAAAEARPRAGHLRARIGLTYERAGRWREATPWLERGLELQPTQPWQVRLALMTCLERAGRTDDAEQVLRDALGAHFGDALTLNNLAYTAADRGVYLDTAARLLRRAVRLAKGRPEEGIIADSLGWCYYQQGRLAEARAMLAYAAELDGRAEILYHLGMVLHALGDTEAAAEQFTAALSMNPTFTPAHEALTALPPQPTPAPASPDGNMEQ